MRGLILPFAAQMTAEHIRDIACATLGNGDIRTAADMPVLMERLFTQVPASTGTLTAWEALSRDLIAAGEGEETDYDTYPGLRDRIEAARTGGAAPSR